MNAPAKLTSHLLARKGGAAPAALGAHTPQPAPRTRTALPGRNTGAPARLTLRLDERRHLRLKLTAAHLQQSLQAVLSEALDRYLDQVSPEMLSNNCVCLAARAPTRADGGED